MSNKKHFSLLSLALLGLPIALHANPQTESLSTLQPSTCINSVVDKQGDQYWSTVNITLSNQCGKSVDFQNATITLDMKSPVNSSFWGDFNNLAYPDNPLQIVSQAQGAQYIASMSLHFPEQSWANTLLEDQQSISLQIGTSSFDYLTDSIKVYLDGDEPANIGSIVLSNITQQPANMTQEPLIDIVAKNSHQIVKKVTLSWGGKQATIENLTPQTYLIQPENVGDDSGLAYTGSANPQELTVTNGGTANSNISYTVVSMPGSA